MKNLIPIALIGASTIVLGLTINNRMTMKKPSADEKMMANDNIVIAEDKDMMDGDLDMTDKDMDSMEYMDVTPKEAKALIDENPELVIIDVSPSYDQGHLPGAINHYLGDGSLDKAIPTLDKTKDYLVYCHVDSVAIAGAQKLIEAGFPTVYRLEGNYSAWVDAGYPVEK